MKMREFGSACRIAVNACVLSERLSGIGRYTHEVLRRLVDRDHEWFLYSHRPITVGDWSKSTVHVRVDKLPGAINLTNRALRLVWAQTILPRWVNEDNVDLLWSPAHNLPRWLSRRIARVVTIHDLVWKHAGRTMRPFARWADALQTAEAVRLADRIITVSHSTARDLVREIPEAESKIRVVHLGGDSLATQAPPETLKLMGVDRPYFLFVGTLEPRKNLYRLLQAFAMLPGDIKKSTLFVIAGDKGWGGADVHAIAEQLGLRHSVRVVNYVTEEILALLYAQALFLAMPSLYEGFGLPIVEAMTHGTPVLTSDRASMPEVSGGAGLFVNPFDVDDIASTLLALISNGHLREDLARWAPLNANRFNWQKTAEETLGVFDEALEERRRKISLRREKSVLDLKE